MTLPPLSPRLLALQPPAVRAALTPGAPGAPPKRARRATGRTVAVGAPPVAVERRGDGSLVVTLPLRLVNSLNARESHWTRHTRVSRERTLLALVLNTAGTRPSLPCTVTFERVGRRLMDEGDGLAACCKALRDETARWLGTGDAPDAPVFWNYVQSRGPYSVRITIASEAV